MCDNCKKVQKLLKKRLDGRKDTGRVAHPNAPLSLLDDETLRQTVRKLRQEKKTLETELQKVKLELAEKCVSVDSALHEGLLKVLSNADESKMDPFVKLFWTEQKKAFTVKDRGMKWHPMLIKFAIFLHRKSPGAYRTLRDCGILKLPGESTLQDYTSIFASKPGWQSHVIKRLANKASKLPESKKMVILLFDEMYIKSDLVFNRRTEELIGYVCQEDFDPSKVRYKQNNTNS